MRELIGQTVDSPTKLELVLYFEHNLHAVEELQGLARRVGRDPLQVDTAVRDLLGTGYLAAQSGSEALGPGTLFRRRSGDPRAHLWAELAQAYEAEPGEVTEAVREADRLGSLRRLTEARRMHDLQARFMAMVSHELRTPATTILAAVQSLVAGKTPLPPDVGQGLAVIERAARRMARIVDDLLLSLNSYSGEAPLLRLGEVDLVALATRVLQEVRSGHADHRWLFEPSEAPLRLRADADGLAEVLEGLLRNSARFSPTGTRIEVTLGGDDDRVWLAVDDEGPGLSPADQRQVFELFYQAQADATRLPGGLGLGLYLARVMVEAHGGTIAVERKTGPGLRITLRLPVAGPPAPVGK